ncbi:hypothetical protein [Geminicoccus roseus]|uniref:hypothetical protein n=1 Tax=Geminicoccus roseus TaxID=404900 RepID=UPI0004260E66|nr:hypothetical protein [Geminicoccus roseus]
MPVILAIFLAILLLGPARPARAAEPVRCAPEIAGALACMAGRACQCGFARGGLVTGTPDGWRWDCSLLRGACDRPDWRDGGLWYDLPPGLSLDASDNSIHVEQTSRSGPAKDGRLPPSSPGPRRLFPEIPGLERPPAQWPP